MSLAFLHAVWTQKFWGWTSSSIVLNQVLLWHPTDLLQSDGARRVAALRRRWPSSLAERPSCLHITLRYLTLPFLDYLNLPCSSLFFLPCLVSSLALSPYLMLFRRFGERRFVYSRDMSRIDTRISFHNKKYARLRCKVKWSYCVYRWGAVDPFVTRAGDTTVVNSTHRSTGCSTPAWYCQSLSSMSLFWLFARRHVLRIAYQYYLRLTSIRSEECRPGDYAGNRIQQQLYPPEMTQHGNRH